MRIHIIGASGSGKTTLATYISSRFAIPHYELDTLGRKHGTDMAAYIEDAFSIANQPTWVTEGSYLIWIDPLLYQADYIVLLEISWSIAAVRIIYRHISKSLRGINPYPGIRGVGLLLKLLKDNRKHYLNKIRPTSVEAEAMRKYLVEHEESIEAPDAKALLTRLEKYKLSVPPTAEFMHKYLEKYKEKVFLLRTRTDRARFLDLLEHR